MPLPEAARRRARPRAALCAALLAVAVVVGLGTVPALADPPPSPAQIEAKKAEAARLSADAQAQLAGVAAAKSTYQTLSAQAATALQELRAAQSAEAAAIARADVARSEEAAARAVEEQALRVEARALEVEAGARERLSIATAEKNASLDAVKRYTAAVYRGGYTAGVGQLIPLLEANSPNEFADRLEMWGRTGDSQGRLLDELEVKQAEMDALKQQAEAARLEAEAARAEAEAQRAVAELRRGEAEAAEAEAEAARGQAVAAKAAADSLAAQAQAAVQSAAALQAATANQAVGAASAAASMQAARDKYLAEEAARVARERRAGIPSIGSGRDGGTAGCGNPYTETRAGYRNGCIPLSALSKLSFYNSHYLRSDAAAAFNRLNEAYQQAFGAPISVTDSYRSYPQQVVLKAQKPVLAATAGRSNHGWGVAVDLGGGINSFGTATHNWMRANAGAFGWIHPAWAQQGGSKPEAWHWEYAG